MRGYSQLTREQRYQIHALMKTGQNQTQMALVLGVHKATISRKVGQSTCFMIRLCLPADLELRALPKIPFARIVSSMIK